MADNVGLAVVGAGYWGPNLIRNAAETAGATLEVVCDLDQERLRKIGRRYPGVRLCTRFEDVLADGKVDAVLVATPAATHHELARRALDAGKDALVEKPLAMTVRDARDLVQAAEAGKRVLMTGHTFIYNA